MLISIVIPSFNQQNLLDRSLATIRNQMYQGCIECIVVDDGSHPPLEIPKWCRSVRIDRSPTHRGSSAAKNAGARAADGDTLCFADSDILHLPDAFTSLRRCMDDWIQIGEPNVLLNVMRVGLPEGYPANRTTDVEYLLRRCRIANLLTDEAMKTPSCCMEQNCGMIRREFFDSIGGYDDGALRSWGYNNQDLCLRVINAGGRISSNVPRVKNKKRLHCFHIWHNAPRSKIVAVDEFKAKWGEEYSQDMVDRAIAKEEKRERESRRVQSGRKEVGVV